MAKDLFVSEVNSPTSVSLTTITAIDPNLNLDWRVENLGDEEITNADLPAYHDAIYFSTDSIFDSNDTLIVEYPVYTMAANGTFEYINNAVNLSSLVGLGNSGYLLFVTDRRNEVEESDETNNVVAAAITITGVDLVVSNITVPTIIPDRKSVV